MLFREKEAAMQKKNGKVGMKETLFEQYFAKSLMFSQYKLKRPHALCMCLIA